MNPTPEKTSVMAPFILMLFLYFIVGLFTVINQQFQVPLKSALLPHDGNMTNALVTLLNFSWFLGLSFFGRIRYPLGRPPGLPEDIGLFVTDIYCRIRFL